MSLSLLLLLPLLVLFLASFGPFGGMLELVCRRGLPLVSIRTDASKFGMGPVMLLLEMSKERSRDNLVRLSGTGPVRLLWSKYKNFKKVKLENEGEIVPLRLFPPRLMVMIFLKVSHRRATQKQKFC